MNFCSPTKDEFCRLAEKGNLIPVFRRLLADQETPLSAYRKIRGQGESFLFESVEGGEHLGRYSFVGSNPRGMIRQFGDEIEWLEGGVIREKFKVVGRGKVKNEGEVADGLEIVEKVLANYKPVDLPGLPRFTGGALGFVGYEFVHDIEPVIPRPVEDELGTPTVCFVIADQLLVFDRVTQTLTVIVNGIIGSSDDPSVVYDRTASEVERIVGLLEQSIEYNPVSFPDDLPEKKFTSNQEKKSFLGNVNKSKEYINSGDIIQVVGSQRFSAQIKASPLDVYRAVRSINPSPYMFLLEFDGYSLVGASPEIHVRCEDKKVEIRPIAGTRPRGENPDDDFALERELLADPKECAEHVMLVDLARNDIGRVCDYGSVEVKDLMIIERYSHVMHIVSQVEGKLKEDCSPYDLIRATFPAGTLSGAPKIRAMQIISEFERTTRGPYGGCVGYFSFSGNLDCCITIRTALLKDGNAYVQAGGGWVADSLPESEYQETINKSKAMIKALVLAESIRVQA